MELLYLKMPRRCNLKMSSTWHQACRPDKDITFSLQTVFTFPLAVEVLDLEHFSITTMGVALLATI